MESVNHILHDEVVSRRTPGVQYRHFTWDSVLSLYDAGLADVARGEPVSPGTSFRGLSVTKTVTAVAVLQLVERGLIELDGSASAHLPGFPYGDRITVRHLLSHTAGIGNPLPLNWIHLEEEHEGFSSRDFFTGVFASNQRLKSSPNARFRYSNLGYVLLGQLVENVSGKPYEEYVAEHIFTPAGLGPGELGFVLDRENPATGHHRRRTLSRLMLHFMIDDQKYMVSGGDGWEAFRPYYVNGAAYGGLVGTADGFMRYAQALMNPSGGLLGVESRELLFAENVLEDGRPSGMALSWFTGTLHGHEYRSHAGGGGGFYAELRVYPDLRRGSVLLFNRSGMSDVRFLDKVDRPILEQL
jgi:D-alanyl-D-alanine carboxypeptidase